MRIVTFKVTNKLLAIIDSFAHKNKMTRSELIRQAIIEYLEKRGVKLDPSILEEESEPRNSRGMVFIVDV